MRVTVVDPPAYTPPYDHALCAALAERGLDVELVTSHFRYGGHAGAAGLPAHRELLPGAAGQRRREGAAAPARHGRAWRGGCARRRAGSCTSSGCRCRRSTGCWCGAFPRPRVLTAHDVLPREVRRGAGAGSRAAAARGGRGRGRTPRRAGRGWSPRRGGRRADARDPARGVRAPRRSCRPGRRPALAGLDGRRVVLFFGLVRPYKGVDVLVEAFAATARRRGAAGRRHAAHAARAARSAARASSGSPTGCGSCRASCPTPSCRPTFAAPTWSRCPTARSSSPACSTRRSRSASPLLLSAVGGFPEVAERGAARLVEPGSVESLRAGARSSCSPTTAARARHARGARCAGRGGALVGARGRADRAARTGGCWRTRREGGRGRLLGLAGPDRLHARRLSAAARAALRGCGAAPRWRIGRAAPRVTRDRAPTTSRT